MIPILTANTVSDQPPQLQLWLQGRAHTRWSSLSRPLAARARPRRSSLAPLVELVETTSHAGRAPPTLVEPVETPARPSFTSAPHCCYRSPVVELPSSTACPPNSAATGEWRNGRRAGFRCQCPSGRGGSSPPSPTKEQFDTKPQTIGHSRSDCGLGFCGGNGALIATDRIWGLRSDESPTRG